jgi:hypothetical protein
MRKEKRDLKITIGNTVVVLLVTMLVASSLLVFQARAQTEYATTTSLSVVPNPVGVGQQVLGIGVVSAEIPPPGGVFHGLYVEITAPDGTLIATEEFDTQTDGSYYFTYAPDSLGTWYFQVFYPGEEIYGGIDSQVTAVYLPSESPIYPITVQYDPVYEIPVLPGQNVIVYPDPTDPRVRLTFQEILTPGIVTLAKTPNPPTGVPPLEDIIGLYYDLDHTFEFTGIVEVGIPYDEALLPPGTDENALTLWHYEPAPAVGDVNGDGKVNLIDILKIMLALGTVPGNRRWNPACDLNSDGRVDLKDLLIALKNYGKTATAWVNVTTRVDTTNNVVYGETPNFPPFGVRK